MDENQARAGYSAAIQLISHDAKIIWDSFRSLLAANTVLIGLAGAVLKLYPQFKELAGILGGLGLVVCLVWALILARSLDFYKYYFAWARKYEKGALGSTDNMVQLGKSFAEGNVVKVGGTDPIRLRWATRLFKAEFLAYIVIAAFAVVYVYLLRAAL